MPQSSLPPSELWPTEQDIDELVEEFGGDPRAAIRALLQDLATLADDREASVSRGYVRGKRFGIHGRQ
jgi:hypothetical protein